MLAADEAGGNMYKVFEGKDCQGRKRLRSDEIPGGCAQAPVKDQETERLKTNAR